MSRSRQDLLVRDKPFLLLGLACALGTLAASLWWTYGGESPLALTLFFVGVAVTALAAFASGVRGEHRRWDGSPLRRGFLTALVALGATLGGALVVNIHTEGGEVGPRPTGDNEDWVSLVDASAREAGMGKGDELGRVLSVVCDEGREEVVLCVVTFEGPLCQYWQITNEDGQNQAVVSLPVQTYAGRGERDPEVGVLCN